MEGVQERQQISLVAVVLCLWSKVKVRTSIGDKTGPIVAVLEEFDTTGEGWDALLELLLPEVEQEAAHDITLKQYYCHAPFVAQRGKRRDFTARLLVVAIRYGELKTIQNLAVKLGRGLTPDEVWPAVERSVRRIKRERTADGSGKELDKQDHLAFVSQYLGSSPEHVSRVSRLVEDRYASFHDGL